MEPSYEAFDTVRRALALKRYEQPPPGYFDYLHARVLDRLTAQEESEPEDWLETLFERFRLRPALVGVCSFALGAFYLAGLGYSGRVALRPAEERPLLPRAGVLEPRLARDWQPYVLTLAPHSVPRSSVAPIMEAGPAASVLQLPSPYRPRNVAPVHYVIPAP